MNILIVTPPYKKGDPSHVGGPDLVYRVGIELEKQGMHIQTLYGESLLFPFKLWKILQTANIIYLSPVYHWCVPITLLAAKMQKKHVVFVPHGSLQRWEGTTKPYIKNIWEKICNLLLPQSFILHVTSKQEAKESKRAFPHAHSVVIPSGVDVPPVPYRKEKHDSHTIALLYIGRIDPKKGIENLLFACTLLDQNKYKLTIAGSGKRHYELHIKTLIQDLGISKNVSMIGHIQGKKRERVWSAADITVVPSHTESFCSVVAESLAREVPAIASRNTPWEELETRRCGKWVSNDPESLARAIKEIKIRQLHEMGKRGREWMEREFSWRKRTDALVSVLSAFPKSKQNDTISEKV